MPEKISDGLSNPLLLITFIGIVSYAIIVDVIDFFMEFIGVGFINPGWGQTIKTTSSKALLTVMDFGTTLVVGGWSFWISKQSTGKLGAKTGKRGLKVGIRTGVALLGEIIPFVGALPFWTLTVIQTFISVVKRK